jgi:2-succinyl-6-hydroxy-2,4-cyclohexadiene-1-carboxylate synthase
MNFGELIETYALHGFLGQPSDWSFLPEANAIDLFSQPSLGNKNFAEWAKWFNDLTASISPKLLIGYSLGGRLALHALRDDPGGWAAAVIVSAHPGLAEGREKRLEHDDLWAKRFLHEPWDRLIGDWNAQPVFENERDHPKRNEADFEREGLSRALTQWSLGKQENLSEALKQLPMPILWAAGENDRKPDRLFHPKSKIWIAPQGGHRIVWTHQSMLREEIKRFKESLWKQH